MVTDHDGSGDAVFSVEKSRGGINIGEDGSQYFKVVKRGTDGIVRLSKSLAAFEVSMLIAPQKYITIQNDKKAFGLCFRNSLGWIKTMQVRLLQSRLHLLQVFVHLLGGGPGSPKILKTPSFSILTPSYLLFDPDFYKKLP